MSFSAHTTLNLLNYSKPLWFPRFQCESQSQWLSESECIAVFVLSMALVQAPAVMSYSKVFSFADRALPTHAELAWQKWLNLTWTIKEDGLHPTRGRQWLEWCVDIWKTSCSWSTVHLGLSRVHTVFSLLSSRLDARVSQHPHWVSIVALKYICSSTELPSLWTRECRQEVSPWVTPVNSSFSKPLPV